MDINSEMDFDAGAAYMFAMLVSVSLWNGTEVELASCPVQENLYFGVREVRGLTSELAVISYDSHRAIRSHKYLR